MPESVQLAWGLLLQLLEAIVTPNWGDLVAMIPLGLLGLVVLVGVRLGRDWFRYAAARPMPVRASVARVDGGGRSLRVVARPLAAVPVGALLAVLALVLGATTRDGVPSLTPVGYLPLIAGIAVALGGVAAAVRTWEGPSGPAPGVRVIRRPSMAAYARLPTPVRRLVLVAAGGALALVAVILPGAPTAGDGGGFNPPLLLAGLLLGLSGAAAAIRAWERAD